MTRRSARSLALVAFVSVVALTLAACGSDKKAISTTPSNTTAAATTATTPTTGGTTIPSSGTPGSSDTTGTTAPAPSTETTTLTPDTSPVSTPPEMIPLPTNAQDYADELVRAWSKHFEGYLARLAGPDPLAVLAAHDSLAGSTWTRSACEGAAGSSYCTYTASGGTKLIVRVGNEAASQGQEHAVTEVRFDPA